MDDFDDIQNEAFDQLLQNCGKLLARKNANYFRSISIENTPEPSFRHKCRMNWIFRHQLKSLETPYPEADTPLIRTFSWIFYLSFRLHSWRNFLYSRIRCIPEDIEYLKLQKQNRANKM